jgi:hypothetical protein
VLAALSGTAAADDALVALVPGKPGARHHATPLAIGPHGEVYAPDAAGHWIRTEPVSTATAITGAVRGDDAVYAGGDGTVYRLADNGWTAVRVVQHGAAILARGAGGHPIAAVDKQLLSLDTLAAGEPVKLAVAAEPITAAAFGAAGPVIATAAGLAQLRGKRFTPIRAPHGAVLVSDRWAVAHDGAIALATGTVTPWPDGFELEIAAAIPGGGLVVVGMRADGPPPRTRVIAELRGRRWKLVPLAADDAAARHPVGVTIDAAGRFVVAFANGDVVSGGAKTETHGHIAEAAR